MFYNNFSFLDCRAVVKYLFISISGIIANLKCSVGKTSSQEHSTTASRTHASEQKKLQLKKITANVGLNCVLQRLRE